METAQIGTSESKETELNQDLVEMSIRCPMFHTVFEQDTGAKDTGHAEQLRNHQKEGLMPREPGHTPRGLSRSYDELQSNRYVHLDGQVCAQGEVNEEEVSQSHISEEGKANFKRKGHTEKWGEQEKKAENKRREN